MSLENKSTTGALPFSRAVRVAHILPWSSIGGTELATLRVIKAAAEGGFESTAFCLDEAVDVRRMFQREAIDVASYTGVEPSYRRPQNYLRAARALAKELRARGINFVHCADVLAAHYTAIAGRLARLPVLCHVRNRFDSISRRDQTFLRAVNRFAFVSQDTWQHFAYPVAKRRGMVLYDGINIAPPLERAAANEIKRDVRKEFGIDDEEATVIGMVARVAPQKDLETLARAASEVVRRYPRVRFLIVGDNEREPAHRAHFQHIQHVLAENAVTPFFVFTGFRQDIARILRGIDIFALVTHHEGLPLVLLEAMSFALPTVATAVDGIPEIVDNRVGRLHPHQDYSTLAAQLLELIENPKLAAHLGEQAAERVRADFSQQGFARNVQNLYREMSSE